jgi:hypothetical protein
MPLLIHTINPSSFLLPFYSPPAISSSRERRLAHDSRGRKAVARGIHDDGRVLRKERGNEDGVYVKGPEGARGESKGGREGVCVGWGSRNTQRKK